MNLGGKFLVATAFASVLVLTGALVPVASSSAASTQKASTKKKKPPPTTTTTTTASQPAPIPLSGSGQEATQAFKVTSGLAILTAQCSCSANFSVEVDDGTGKMVDIPINVIGTYNGSVAESLPGGSYILNVDADSSWTVTVTQPRKQPATAVPHTYTGTGQQVIGPFSSKSTSLRIKSTNTSTGGGNFAVSLFAASDGSQQDIPVNEIGSFSGSAISQENENGPYYAAVDSDGNWTLQISNP